MTRLKQSIELLTLFVGIAGVANGQSNPTVNQTGKHGSCINIVALSGAKVDCSHLTPAQSKALENIPTILKMALENQTYLEEILKRLNEVSTNPPPVVCKDNANCGVSTGQTGGITAGQIVNQEPITWYEWNGVTHKRQGNTFTAVANDRGVGGFSEDGSTRNEQRLEAAKGIGRIGSIQISELAYTTCRAFACRLSPL